MSNYSRSQMAKLAGIHVETLRYYERNKVIPTPQRTQNGYRVYTDEFLERLQLIKQAKECGFTIEEIKILMPVMKSTASETSVVVQLIDTKILDFVETIQRLEKMKKLLEETREEIFDPKCPIIQEFIKKYILL